MRPDLSKHESWCSGFKSARWAAPEAAEFILRAKCNCGALFPWYKKIWRWLRG